MKLLANENFPLASVIKLRKHYFDIFSITENCVGIPDKEVLEIAIQQERTILTFDRDYGELVFKYKIMPLKGIIYFRWSIFSPEDPADFCIKLFSKVILFDNTLTVIDRDGTLRQRKY